MKYPCPRCGIQYPDRGQADNCAASHDLPDAMKYEFKYRDRKGAQRIFVYTIPGVDVVEKIVGPRHLWLKYKEEDGEAWCRLPLPLDCPRAAKKRFNWKDGRWFSIELPDDYDPNQEPTTTWFEKDRALELWYMHITTAHRRQKLYLNVTIYRSKK